jgi:WD40 repeat protein
MLTGHTGWVRGCAFSPDGALLATTSNDGIVRLWRVSDSTRYAVLTGHRAEINGCAFSPDGALLATASDDRTVRLWRISNGTSHMEAYAKPNYSQSGVSQGSLSRKLTTRRMK